MDYKEIDGVFTGLDEQGNALLLNLVTNMESVKGLDAALAEKQNKLTGTQGQVLGFDSQGNPTAQNADSIKGAQGADGQSAYQLAVKNGFSGTETAWLASLKGADGQPGVDGKDGEAGPKGEKGDPGQSTAVNAVLSSSAWTGSAAPFQQTISVSGLTQTQNGLISIGQTATVEQRTAARNAILAVTGQATGRLTLSADGERPNVDIPVTVILFD